MDGRLSEILTGDKTWAHYFEPQIKIDKMQFRKRAKHPGITKKFRSEHKERVVIFVNRSGTCDDVGLSYFLEEISDKNPPEIATFLHLVILLKGGGRRAKIVLQLC